MNPEQRLARLAARRAAYAARKAAGKIKPRDYKAEEQRRNERAQERGFTSRAQLRRARAAGVEPTAKATKQLNEAVKSGLIQAPNRWTGTTLSPDDIAYMRKRSREWSDKHSMSPNSKFNPRWRQDKVVMYYMMYVNGYNPEGDTWPVIGFRAEYSDRDLDLVTAYFTSIGITAASIEKFNYLKGA